MMNLIGSVLLLLSPSVAQGLSPSVAQGLSPSVAQGQDLASVRPRPVDVPMHSMLWDLQEAAVTGRFAELSERAAVLHVPLDATGRVRVELHRQGGVLPAADDLLRAAGAEPLARYHDRQGAWIAAANLETLARSLPAGVSLLPPALSYPDDVVGEGPAAIGSDTYRDLGADGTGIKIAVIDAGFIGLTAARIHGDAPSLSRSVLIDLTGLGLEAGTQHGTGCVEAVFDHAPGADYRIYRILGPIDLGLAVLDGLANGVDVFSLSQSYYLLGWDDNSGPACAAALTAVNSGAVFCTSAGNRARTHYQGPLVDNDGDSWHEFGPNDESNGVTVDAGSSLNVFLSWDLSGGPSSYDLFLVVNGALVASSNSPGSIFELISWANNSAFPVTAQIRVLRIGGGQNTEFELFSHNPDSDYEYFTSAGSTTSPTNAIHPRVISVGAVRWNNFPSGSGSTGILASYSSRGPTNGGVMAPTIVGPTNTVGVTYSGSGGFAGTSAAAPNVAGAIGAFWSAQVSWSSQPIGSLVPKQATLFADWGAPGQDNAYGAGGMKLGAHVLDTRWLDSSLANFSGSITMPYATLDDAYAATPTGGRILIVPAPGSGYPGTPSSALTRSMTIETLATPVVLGGQ